MATAREARKRRGAKTPSRALQLALASHEPDVLESGDDSTPHGLPALTFVFPRNKATEAFAVTELLEAIIIQLARKEALLCQRVNRTWKDNVQGSIKLKRFLFLAPEKKSGVVGLVARTPRSAELRVSKYAQHDNAEAQGAETHFQPVVPNPLLFFNTDLHNRGASLEPCSISYADLLAHGRLPYHNIDLLVGLFSGSMSVSSCLDMFLTQPPVCEVNIELNILRCSHCQGQETCCFGLSHVKNSKGLRVRDIFAAARSFHFSQPAPCEDDEQENITSISIGFQAVVHGSKNGILLLPAEDMRLAKLEALKPNAQTADVVEVA